jgi:SAM-dependent methyltransferase
MDHVNKQDVIGWDIVNWFKAITFWEKYHIVDSGYKKCLEVGASNGGLSLWMANNNNEVVCSDIQKPGKEALNIHAKYTCSNNISYEALDATNIAYDNYFDVVAFKSIVGGIAGYYGDNSYKAKAIKEMHKALKPGGKLLFAENLKGTRFHVLLRKYFGTKDWNYLGIDEINIVFGDFRKINYTTVGFFGCLGRTEKQRIFLGKVDNLIERFIPKNYRYIVIGIAEK